MRAAERGADGTLARQRLGQGRHPARLPARADRAARPPADPFPFYDKDTYPLRALGPEDGVRIVPGGSAIRDGCYVAPRRRLHAADVHQRRRVRGRGHAWWTRTRWSGSCAQIGRRVHLSAAAQIGGVLEPAGALPVIIEDEVLVGGNCGVYEGTIVRERAVLAPGTLLTGGTAVFDLVHDRVYRREGDRPLEIPAGAVVVPGTRPVRSRRRRARRGSALYAPVIVKYRDEKTDTACGWKSCSADPPMTTHTHYLWFETKRRQEIIDITDEVAEQVRASGVREGFVLVSAMHISASVFVNDHESGLWHDILDWLEETIAPWDPDAVPAQRDRRGQRRRAPAEPDRGSRGHRADHGRASSISGPWQRVFYGEWDGQRRKRVIIKVMGEAG